MGSVEDGLNMHWMTLEDVFHKTVSYAQNQEDILLARVLKGASGFYVDVGANHPVFHSVTKLFSERGWRGINVEPSPVLHELLVADRPRDVNLNVGLGSASGTLTFFESTTHHGWSTFVPELAAVYRAEGEAIVEHPVPVTTLAEICDRHVDGTIDFLKIDAEGFERDVLLGSDFSRWRPRVLVIENSWPEAWEPLVGGIGYLPAAFDGLNRFYVRAEDEALLPEFRATANALDNFIPHEYVRLYSDLMARIESVRPTVLSGLRHDARRVARKIRSSVRSLTARGLGRRAG